MSDEVDDIVKEIREEVEGEEEETNPNRRSFLKFLGLVPAATIASHFGFNAKTKEEPTLPEPNPQQATRQTLERPVQMPPEPEAWGYKNNLSAHNYPMYAISGAAPVDSFHHDRPGCRCWYCYGRHFYEET